MELLDCQSRARNIILFNVLEFSASLPGQLDDTSFLKDVFTTMSILVNLVSVNRLGKISSKLRLLRVTLPAFTVVFDILKVKRNLIDISRLSTIRILSDLTLQQRKYFSSIISELKRKNAGEHNL